jgi:hypothetical protein
VDRTGAIALRGVRCGAIGCVTALLIGLTAPFLSGCASSPRTFDFGGLSQADRLEITGSSTRGTRTVTDESTIQAAARFLSRHQEGWSNSWGSGAAPFFIRFFQGTRDLGSFGVGPGFVTNGPWTCHPPAEEMQALFRRLGLPWQRD